MNGLQRRKESLSLLWSHRIRDHLGSNCSKSCCCYFWYGLTDVACAAPGSGGLPNGLR